MSPSSLDAAKASLSKVGLLDRVDLQLRDIAHDSSDPTAALFDCIVLSDVLEHLENPLAALKTIRRHLAPHGKIFINVRVNSPAPDHIFLLKTPEEARELVEAVFKVFDCQSFPLTGYSEAAARKQRLTLSCIFVAGHFPDCLQG